MISITRDLRKDLEKTVKQARRVAEAGARQAVQQLRVGDGDAPKDLAADQRALRTRLRAHGRQLGDRREAKTGAQETAHLVQECAYEHWHRMLFARFLAETDLLIEPQSGVAITLDEVQELAREKATDWLELASEYAERMLPQIFRKDDPVLQIALPPETRSAMEDLLKGLSKAVFEADDSLGWVYQFWQADKKEEVNKAGTKIGADELPAVTQLFTEDYMVLFLLHNTLGAWWAGKVLAGNPKLATSAVDEAALRAACKVGDIDWAYLRFVRDKGGDGAKSTWRPAAGRFEDWPNAAKNLTVLDPCMGSGHFLVFALPILIALRMAEESLSQSAAIDAVLRDNLFGLEIDPRCTQIAAFNLGFAAWRRVGYRPLPPLNLACSGLTIGVTKAEWLKLGENAVTAADPAARRDLLGVETNLLTLGLEERVKNGLEALYDLFAKAPWLGSLIEPTRAGADIFREGFNKLEPLLASILAAPDTDETRELAVAAQGMAKAAELLSRRFDLVITNVPFLAAGKMISGMREHVQANWADSKADLSTAMMSRMLELAAPGGSIAVVTPQNWHFLGSYRKLRKALLLEKTLKVICDLGPAAFHDMNWWAARTALTIIGRAKPGTEGELVAIDAEQGRAPEIKALALRETETHLSAQSAQLENPDHRLTMIALGSGQLLSTVADYGKGSTTGDRPRFLLRFWELPDISNGVLRWLDSPKPTEMWSGRELVLTHALDSPDLNSQLGCRIHGQEVWGKPGVALTKMRSLDAFLYDGEVFDDNVGVITAHQDENTEAIAAFVTSSDYLEEIRKVDKVLKVTAATLVKVPFDLAKWLKLAPEKYPQGLPEPYSEDPTQWLFHGNPAVAKTGCALQTSILILLGYRWPATTEADVRIGPRAQDLARVAARVSASHADPDGIVCLTALKGEAPAEQRLNALLSDAFGVGWSAAKLSSLLAEASYAGKSLDDWIRDGFFTQHCELFHQYPFVWQFWDGRHDGFNALVNYHRLAGPNGEGRRTLEKLIYSYLGDWIDRQRADQKAGVEGADARLAHAEHLKTELIKILDGEQPYDIFVRWKSLSQQPIGWDPDINDGVRMNIRPFMTARTLNARGTNACILRATPKIKWDKDRGKESSRDIANFPWFWSWDEVAPDFTGGEEFDGNRWNDLHYSRAVKQAARDRHRDSVGGMI